jgi:hypothetical protein
VGAISLELIERSRLDPRKAEGVLVSQGLDEALCQEAS